MSFPHTLAAETILTEFLLFSPKNLSPRQGSSAAWTQWAGLTPERGCGRGGLGESATVSRGEGGGPPRAACMVRSLLSAMPLRRTGLLSSGRLI